MAKEHYREVADLLERFVRSSGDRYEWDDFISTPFHDPVLDAVRRESASLPDVDPPQHDGEYCGERGAERLLALAELLRRSAQD